MAVLDYAGLGYFKGKLINALFPIGVVIQTTSARAPRFGGTWEEVLATYDPVTWDQLGELTWDEVDTVISKYTNYVPGTAVGNSHLWRRTA